MPLKLLPFEKPEQDGRRKIMPDAYPAVRLHFKTSKSLRETAQEFGISHMTVSAIVNPKKHKESNRKRRANKVWRNQRASREDWAEAKRKFRAKKRKLGLMGKTNGQ